MSNTARKIKRRRANLAKHWDFYASKSLLLSDKMVSDALISIDGMQRLLQILDCKPSKRNGERLRDALLRAKGLKGGTNTFIRQLVDTQDWWTQEDVVMGMPT